MLYSVWVHDGWWNLENWQKYYTLTSLLTMSSTTCLIVIFRRKSEVGWPSAKQVSNWHRNRRNNSALNSPRQTFESYAWYWTLLYYWVVYYFLYRVYFMNLAIVLHTYILSSDFRNSMIRLSSHPPVTKLLIPPKCELCHQVDSTSEGFQCSRVHGLLWFFCWNFSGECKRNSLRHM